WLVRRSVEIWRSAPARGTSKLDWSLIRAATIVPFVLLAHSLVDFPIRTSAIMAVMAFSCAPLIELPGRTQCMGETKIRIFGRARHAEKHRPAPALTPAKPAAKPSPKVKTGLEPPLSSAMPKSLQVKISDTPSQPPIQRWGADIKWPK